MPVPTAIHRESERPTDVGILAMEMYFPRRVSVLIKLSISVH